MPKISIIVPVYKVEPYLRCCIDSILAQTFTDFEVILVDDGSPDNCGAICDEYAQKDDRIVVIHTENQGVSAARNTGLDWVFANSDSQWITFVDSDDYIVPPYLEHLHRAAVETGADVVTTHGHWFTEDSELCNAPCNVISQQSMSGREACLSFYRDEEILSPSPWGKLCQKVHIKDLRFPIGISYAEDEEFVVKLLYTSSKIVSLRSWLYCYRQRSSSAIHRAFSLWMYDRLRAIDFSIQYFENQEEQEIANLAEQRKLKFTAEYTLRAHGAQMTESVPVQYKMPLWKALYIVVSDTVCHGGIKFIAERTQNFFNRLGRKC